MMEPPISSTGQDCNVRVVVRVRPLVSRERIAGAVEAIHLVPGSPQIVAGSDHSYSFDQVFGSETEQVEVFEETVVPILNGFLEGFNCTILAYGQTGSGKTFTMGTGLDGSLDECTAGIVPRAVSYLESRLPSEHELYVSFLEIYNEEIVDLLNSAQQADSRGSGRKGILAIREDGKGGIFVTGIKEERIEEGPSGILECLRKGSLCRTTKSTQMNLVSSRSHAIFTINLRQKRRLPDSMEWQTFSSKLHFVDLAGSERLKRTLAQGDRAKESISINGGLLALGNVISALGDESKKTTHVPYRDSKLTRLLQDSLGGNSRTLMIACVSPSSDNLLETLNTLKYANRARNIKNRVQLCQDSEGDAAFQVIQLKKQVASLKQQLNQQRVGLRSASAESIGSRPTGASSGLVEELRRKLEEMGREKRAVEQERDALKAALNNTGSPKTKEYLRTISDLRSRIVQLESSKVASATPGKKTILSGGGPQRPGAKRLVPSSPPPPSKIEPGTPKWFRAADDLLDRAKTEIEQAYDAMDRILYEEAPSAYPDDEDMLVEARKEEDGNPMLNVPAEQLAAAIATRTEAMLGQVRVDLQIRAELIQQIETCKQEFLFMRERYEERIALLTQNMKSVQADCDRALSNHININTSNEARAGLNRLTRQKYEERIKKLGKEINELKDKLRQALHTGTSRSSANDCLVRNLRSSLTNLKIENGRLQSQLTDELGRLRSQATEQETLVRDLRVSARTSQEAARKWKRAHEFQKALLQKRIEQCLHARAKIRQLVNIIRNNKAGGSPAVRIDWGSPGWRALDDGHQSPLLPSRLKRSADASVDPEIPTSELGSGQVSPVKRFPPISQLGKASISAHDLTLEDETGSDLELATATSQLHIESAEDEPGLLRVSSQASSIPASPFLSHIGTKPTISNSTAVGLPKSILRASPLLPRRRDFFGRLAEAAAAYLSPSKQQHPQPAPKRDKTDQ